MGDGGEYGKDLYFPKFYILNPVFTFTLPKYQMAAGFYDIMNHITEQYFSGEDDKTSELHHGGAAPLPNPFIPDCGGEPGRL